jgi:hypothetical protein
LFLTGFTVMNSLAAQTPTGDNTSMSGNMTGGNATGGNMSGTSGSISSFEISNDDEGGSAEEYAPGG